MAATDALNNQMQTGQMDAPTLVGAVKDSGAIDVSLKEGERDDHATFAMQEENCQDAMYTKNQSHKKTQTEMYTRWKRNALMNLCEFNIHRKTT